MKVILVPKWEISWLGGSGKTLRKFVVAATREEALAEVARLWSKKNWFGRAVLGEEPVGMQELPVGGGSRSRNPAPEMSDSEWDYRRDMAMDELQE